MTSALNLFHLLNFTEEELLSINDYMKVVESHLEKKHQRMASNLDKKLEISQTVFIEGYLKERPDLYRLDFFHPNLLRQSMVVSLYAFLEKTLNSICMELQDMNGFELSFKDIQGKGIIRSQAYIKKVIKIPFPDQSQHWTTILLLNEIRNAIVHSGGDLESKILEKLEKRQDLKHLFRADDEGFFMEKGFTETMSAHVAKFLTELRNVLPKYLNE